MMMMFRSRSHDTQSPNIRCSMRVVSAPAPPRESGRGSCCAVQCPLRTYAFEDKVDAAAEGATPSARCVERTIRW
jgi:hypothetical protein